MTRDGNQQITFNSADASEQDQKCKAPPVAPRGCIIYYSLIYNTEWKNWSGSSSKFIDYNKMYSYSIYWIKTIQHHS